MITNTNHNVYTFILLEVRACVRACVHVIFTLLLCVLCITLKLFIHIDSQTYSQMNKNITYAEHSILQ